MKRMIENMRYSVFLIVAVSTLFMACVEFEQVSPIPEIEFKEFEFFDAYDSLFNPVRQGILEFSFIDGDADLGVYDEINADTNLPDSIRYNLFLIPYEKKEGLYYLIDLNFNPNYTDLHYLIPYDQKLDRVGQNKTVKGFIRVNVDFRVEPPYDTLMFKFYIYDRALNKSNIEQTVDFSIEISDSIPVGI